MKKILVFIVACLSNLVLFSQTHWNPVSSTTSGSMVLIGKIQINGVDQTSDHLELGVFCGDECRGACIAHLFTYVQPNYYMVDPMIYGDAGDMFTFKLYDHSLGQELNLNSPEALAFNENGEGNPFVPYILNFTGGAIENYTITATANPTNGGTVSGGGTYNHGQSCTLTATPATGYSFVRWTKNGTQVSTSATYTFTVTESAAYVAHFQAQSYSITATANPTNGGTVSGGGTYNHGQSCTLMATPATGYSFVRWTKNGTQVSTSANYTFTVTESAAYVAHFQAQSYTITATANPTNGGTVSGGGTYNHGQSCTLTATPATGYSFVRWTKNGTQVSTSANYTFTVTESAAYVAHFQAQSYTITATANPTNGGTVSGGGTYNHGQSCTLTATAATGYSFVRWTKNGTQVSTSATYTFTVTESATYVAHFQAQSYTITATANPTNGGTVSGGGTYNHGQSCTLTATANNGYTFINWKENGSVVSTNSTYSFTVTGARTLVANFNENIGSGNIVFADANVKALCIANWDTNGDGELSYAEAAAVMDLGVVFKDNDDITTFNELQYFTGLTAIGERAFYNCDGLTSVIVPNSVTTLNQYAFAFSYYLTSVGLSNSLMAIGNHAFDGCSRLGSINLPNTVVTIGNSAFYDCTGLVSLEIPASVVSIGNYAFCYCTGLAQITVAAGNGVFDSRNNCNAIIETSTNTLRFGCKNSFIPNTVTALGIYAFLNMDVTSVHVPESVMTIGTRAFGGCVLLEQITVAQNNPVFDSRNNCNAIIETNTNKLVAGCKNTIIPNTITTIGDNAFYNCEGLTSVIIPNSVTTLSQYAFAFCDHLISVEMPNSLTAIGNYAFDGCSRLNSINIPNTVVTIGNSAFFDCTGLVSLEIPAYVTSIGNYAFYNCMKLTHIICWANNPPTLGNNAFMDVDKSIPVYVPVGRMSTYQTVLGWNEFTNYLEIAFNEENIFFADFNVKALCVDNWDTNGDGELSYVEAAVVTNLGEVFKNNSTIISFDELQYFTGLTTIGEDAFRGCGNLSLVTIPNAVNSIGNSAFRGCYDLTLIIIPNSVTTIGNYAFYSCYDLVLASIGSSVISIGNYALYSCGNLLSLTIPSSVTSIGNDAFEYCYGLEQVVVEAGNTTYDSRENCNAIINTVSNTLIVGCKNTVIPNSVTSIGNNAFRSCYNLTSIAIPNSVTSIGNYAFSWCTSLESITMFAETPPALGYEAFNNVTKTIPLYVPCGSMAAYQSATGWNEFTNIQEVCTQSQTIELSQGYNWFSTNLDITLDDLQDALVAALPGASSANPIKITAQNGKYRTYSGSSWRGNGFVWEVNQMYIIQSPAAAEMTLQGLPLVPSEHSISIVNGYNWIGFPLNTSMSVSEAFAGFNAVTNDKVVAQDGSSSTYRGTAWRNSFNLVPGQGYIFKSASSGTRILIFPTSAK